MHLNHYFLRRLTTELQYKIIGMELLTCFSQTTGEIVLGFANSKEEFYIRLFISSELTCLTFAEEFHKARQGADNYFREVMQTKVLAVNCISNDRSIKISMNNGYQLVLKLHGRNASLLLANKNNIVEKSFPPQGHNDTDFNIEQLTKPSSNNIEDFKANDGDLYKVFPAMGKELKTHIEEQTQNLTSLEDKLTRTNQILEDLQESPIYIVKLGQTPALRLWPEGTIVSSTYNAIEAANQFAKIALGYFAIYREKQSILNQLQRKLKQAQKFAINNALILHTLETSIQNDEIANIIMANLHQLKQGMTEATLFNFYTEQEITVKLKRDLSPQKNAENYYRKSKNQKIERQKLRNNISNKEQLALITESQIEEITAIESLKELRTYIKDNQLEKPEKAKGGEEEPLFKRYEAEGFEILIGRNSANNDLLTTKVAKKDDLWLHARNVAGSHVVIKQIPGKPFPKSVIEKAAQLAAYYSKGKTDSLCPVMYTPKKYVRKPKGANLGQVVVEKEEVILVKPGNQI